MNDPTVTRCIGYAMSWGASQLIVVNLFGYRATNPKHLYQSAPFDPVGPLNDQAIVTAARYAHSAGGKVVAAWGVHGAHLDRDKIVRALLAGVAPLYHLKATKAGQPMHPLYLPKSLQPTLLP